MQLDDPARGFSFMADGPLDMRMSGAGESAADVLATRGEEEIADILFQLGEERHSRRIARAIVEARQVAPLATTRQLAALVARVLGRGKGDDKHPATRTFQALRIFVNDELGELNRALVGAERVLRPGGRLAVVTFHSLEDRVVKRFLARRSGRSEGASRHGPPLTSAPPPASFRIINRAPLTPSQPELEVNPRARSAKLRSAMRTSAPAYPPETARELGIPEPAGDRRA
jgi:16S rRNA (cytosine1402-N4)-methyltransferase